MLRQSKLQLSEEELIYYIDKSVNGNNSKVLEQLLSEYMQNSLKEAILLKVGYPSLAKAIKEDYTDIIQCLLSHHTHKMKDSLLAHANYGLLDIATQHASYLTTFLLLSHIAPENRSNAINELKKTAAYAVNSQLHPDIAEKAIQQCDIRIMFLELFLEHASCAIQRIGQLDRAAFDSILEKYSTYLSTKEAPPLRNITHETIRSLLKPHVKALSKLILLTSIGESFNLVVDKEALPDYPYHHLKTPQSKIHHTKHITKDLSTFRNVVKTSLQHS